MAYSKLPLVIQDYGLGLQTINQHNANLEALRLAYEAEHGYLESPALIDRTAPAGTVVGAHTFGRHDTPLIPRSVVRISSSTPALSVPQVQVVWGGAFITNASAVTNSSGTRYFLTVSGLSEFWAEAIAEQDDNTVTRVLQCVTSLPAVPSPSNMPGVYVNALELSAGAFDLAAFSFVLALYGFAP